MITIGMPIHGTVDARVMLSFASTVADLTRRGVAWRLDAVLQDSSVSRARNMIAARFLRTGSDPRDRLLFIDADMVWTPEDVQTLLFVNEDVVAAPYAKKSATGGMVGVLLEGAPRPEGAQILEAARLGTGFMAITRAALERMVTAYPETVYRVGSEAADSTGETVHALFSETLRDGRFLVDDWTFCARWQAIGGRMWMHNGIRPGHVGTHVYTLPEVFHG